MVKAASYSVKMMKDENNISCGGKTEDCAYCQVVITVRYYDNKVIHCIHANCCREYVCKRQR